MPQQTGVVVARHQHPEEEHQGEEYHHRLHWHGKLHLGHQRHVDGKGRQQCHAEQSSFEARDEKQQHQTRQRDKRQIVEILQQKHRVGHGKQQGHRHGDDGCLVSFEPRVLQG